MADYTYATIIVPAADAPAARQDYPNYFAAPLSPTGQAPVTHYASSGPFSNDELNEIVNEATWAKTVTFGHDTQAALTKAGLLPVQE